MARTGERENLMKMIYQMGVQEDFSAEEYEKFTALQADSQITEYFVNGYRAAASNLKEIDELIDRYSVRWEDFPSSESGSGDSTSGAGRDLLSDRYSGFGDDQ